MGCLGYLVGNSKSKNNQPDEATIAKPYIAALKRKIDELCVKREQAPPFICANGGNVCKNPCYEYQQKIETNCPKCGGEVTKDFENGKTEKEEWDKYKGMYVKKTYYDDNIPLHLIGLIVIKLLMCLLIIFSNFSLEGKINLMEALLNIW